MVHQLRSRPAPLAASYLEMYAHQYQLDGLADQVSALGLQRPWSAPWARCRLTHPHQVIGRHTETFSSTSLVAVNTLDGDQIIVSADDVTQAWDATTGSTLGRWPAPSVDGRHLLPGAIAQLDHHPTIIRTMGTTICVQHLSDDKAADPLLLASDGTAISAVATGSHNGRPVIVSAHRDGGLQVWDLALGTLLGRRTSGHEAEISALAVAEVDGETLIVSGYQDGRVSVQALDSDRADHLYFSEHTDRINVVGTATVAGRSTIVSVSFWHLQEEPGGFGLASFWDLATGKLAHEMALDLNTFTPAGALGEIYGRATLVTSDPQDGVRIWDLDTRSVVRRFAGWETAFAAVGIGEVNGRAVVVSRGYDGTVRRWDLPTRTLAESSADHNVAEISAVDTGQLDGRPIIVTGGVDGVLQRWDQATGTPIGQPIAAHQSAVRVIAVTTSDRGVRSVAVADLGGRQVIVSGGGHDNTVRMWDLRSGAPIGQPITGHRYGVGALAVCRLDDRPVVVSASQDGTVLVSDPATGQHLREPLVSYAEPKYREPSLAVAELDGRPVVLYGHSRDHAVQVMDLASGTQLYEPIKGHINGVTGLAAGRLADRPVVISAGLESVLQIWDCTTGRMISETYPGIWRLDGAPRENVDIPVDGHPAVRISLESVATVRVWDLATGAPIGSLVDSEGKPQPVGSHTDQITTLAARELPEGTVIVSGGEHGTIGVWSPEPLETVDLGCRMTAIALALNGAVVIGSTRGLHVLQWRLPADSDGI